MLFSQRGEVKRFSRAKIFWRELRLGFITWTRK